MDVRALSGGGGLSRNRPPLATVRAIPNSEVFHPAGEVDFLVVEGADVDAVGAPDDIGRERGGAVRPQATSFSSLLSVTARPWPL
jgi:hypothetical protein